MCVSVCLCLCVMGLNNLTILNEVPLKVHESSQQSGYMWVDRCHPFAGGFASFF